MNKIYHGCGLGFEDGTVPLIKNQCVFPTSHPFWKHPEDLNNQVKTRSQERNEELADQTYKTPYIIAKKEAKRDKVAAENAENVSYP